MERKFKAGQRVWLRPLEGSNGARDHKKPFETVITKIGRSYIYVDYFYCEKLSIITYRNNDFEIYDNKEEITEYEEGKRLEREIAKIFTTNWRNRVTNLTNDQLQRIMKIIEE